MADINDFLKIIFVITAIVFIVSLISLPKTDCEACEFKYKNKTIDGNEAFKIFEDGCISYAKPWGATDFNISTGGLK